MTIIETTLKPATFSPFSPSHYVEVEKISWLRKDRYTATLYLGAYSRLIGGSFLSASDALQEAREVYSEMMG